MSLLLAIESSCDEMAMAVLKDQREFLSSVVASQIDIHAMYGGVVPEIASRKHVECVSVVLKETLKQANIKMEDLDAICVTKGPGLVGSLHIGLQVAKTLSLAYDKPLIGVHHIAGHIYANNYEKDIVYPALCLVVSGGHTELVLMKHPYSFEVIGETLDDAVGEAYDKVGRVLNLPYPGGPVLPASRCAPPAARGKGSCGCRSCRLPPCAARSPAVRRPGRWYHKNPRFIPSIHFLFLMYIVT